jgi:hypothetical protein
VLIYKKMRGAGYSQGGVDNPGNSLKKHQQIQIEQARPKDVPKRYEQDED